MKIICLIPAFNEAGNLEELVKKIYQEFKKRALSFGILFIIQGNDASRQILNRLKEKYPQINYLYYPQPLGIGKAYQIGFNKLNTDYTHILTLDADLNHQPTELDKFLSAWKKDKPDIIIGSRFISGGKFQDSRFWKRTTSLLVNKIITALLGINLSDITSGFRLINKKAVSKIKNNLKETGYPSYMEFILLAHKYGLKAKEVSITYYPRKWGKSKMGKLSTFRDYLLFLPKIFFIS